MIMKYLLSLLLLACLSFPIVAAEVGIGDLAPDFADLPNIDGKSLSLSDFKSAKAVVLVFTCNSCPIAQEYQARFIALAKKYESQGVVFVAINAKSTEKIPDMKSHAEQAGFCFPYVDDADTSVAKAFNAKATPHLFVLDQQRKVAYSGAFDDHATAEKVKQHFVSDAVEAVLAGKQPSITSTKPFGCGIQYKN
jgi:peroxiredoxin